MSLTLTWALFFPHEGEGGEKEERNRQSKNK